jgi:hypothetical protein
MFVFGLILGLVVGSVGTGFIAYRLFFSKKVEKVITILNGPGTEKEKIKAIAELFGVPTSLII